MQSYAFRTRRGKGSVLRNGNFMAEWGFIHPLWETGETSRPVSVSSGTSPYIVSGTHSTVPLPCPCLGYFLHFLPAYPGSCFTVKLSWENPFPWSHPRETRKSWVMLSGSNIPPEVPWHLSETFGGVFNLFCPQCLKQCQIITDS